MPDACITCSSLTFSCPNGTLLNRGRLTESAAPDDDSSERLRHRGPGPV